MSTTPHIVAAPGVLEARRIPAELDRWNWGAFLLNWIWGIGNGTPIALLALFPPLTFPMMLVLGVKGSAWAWRNKRWDGVEHYKRAQRHWAIAGVVVWAVVIGFFVAIFAGAFTLANNSEAYKLGVAAIHTNPIAANALGTPVVTRGSRQASISIDGNSDSGKASLEFPASGPKASGTAFVEAVKKNGVWSLTRLYLKLDGSNTEIDIIGSSPNTSPSL